MQQKSHKFARKGASEKNNIYCQCYEKVKTTVGNINCFQMFIWNKPLLSDRLFHKELEPTEEHTLQSHRVLGW